MLSEQQREAISQELAYLNAQRDRGLSRQMEAQVGWLQARLELHRLEQEADREAAELARVREYHAAARARITELKAAMAEHLAVSTDQMLEAAGAVGALAGELAGLELIERELRKRSREQEAEVRELSTLIKKQTSRVMALRAHTGIPG